jgi:hypothetical protein
MSQSRSVSITPESLLELASGAVDDGSGCRCRGGAEPGTIAASSPARPEPRKNAMSVDERHRLQLADAAKRALGDDEGITLMELLPPVGWADVATKQDLELLEHKLVAAMNQGFLSLTWKLFAINAATVAAMLGALVAIAKL